MEFDLLFVDDYEYMTELRAVFGVTDDELPDALIDTDMIIGNAERYVVARVPGYVAMLEDDVRAAKLLAAVVYMAASLLVRPLKLRLLQYETDNKSTAQRFAKALEALDARQLKGEADAIINELTGTVAADVSRFSGVMPAIDPVTGNDPSSYR